MPGGWLLPDGYLEALFRRAPRSLCRRGGRGLARGGPAAGHGHGDHVGRYQEALTCCGNRAPATAIQAQFSVSYGVARSLAHGRLDPRADNDDALTDLATGAWRRWSSSGRTRSAPRPTAAAARWKSARASPY